MTAHTYTQKINEARRLLANPSCNFGRFHLASYKKLEEMNEVEIAAHFTVIKSYINDLGNGVYETEAHAIKAFLRKYHPKQPDPKPTAAEAQAYATNAVMSLDSSTPQFSDLEITNRAGVRSIIPADIPDLSIIDKALQYEWNIKYEQTGKDIQLVWNLLHAARDFILHLQQTNRDNNHKMIEMRGQLNWASDKDEPYAGGDLPEETEESRFGKEMLELIDKEESTEPLIVLEVSHEGKVIAWYAGNGEKSVIQMARTQHDLVYKTWSIDNFTKKVISGAPDKLLDLLINQDTVIEVKWGKDSSRFYAIDNVPSEFLSAQNALFHKLRTGIVYTETQAREIVNTNSGSLEIHYALTGVLTEHFTKGK